MLVPRPRVEHRLRAALAHAALVVVHAPLGSGKTAAVTLALNDVPNVVRVNARPWHSRTFAREMIAAIRTVRDGFGRLALGALESGSSAAHLGHVFARELAHVDEPLTIVIDDVHLFEDRERFFRFVDAAVSALPDNVRIIAIGRSLPQAPLLRTFARKRIAIIDPQSFALDRGEIRAFAKAFGSDANEGTLERLQHETEGWAAGVVLALTTRGIAFDAAARHILSQLGNELSGFLEETAVFETLDNGVVDIAPRLDALRKRGVLIDEVAAGSFRLNPMLREMLLGRLRERDGEPRAHAAAAAAYARAGNISAAFYHACHANDSATATALLHDNAEAAVAAGDYDRVEALAGIAGEETAIGRYANALLAKARATDDVRERFAAALDAANAEEDARIAFAAEAQLLERDIGMLADVPKQRVDALALRSTTLPPPDRVRAAMLQGWHYAVDRDFRSSLESIAGLLDVDDDVAQFNAGVLRAYALTALGSVTAAQETLDALLARFEVRDAAVLQTLTLVWFARLALLWGTTTAASEAAAEAQRLASALELRGDEAALLSALCELSTHHGDVAATVRYAEAARAVAGRAWYATDRLRIHAFAGMALARAAFLGHDNAIARDLALRVAAEQSTPDVQRAAALAEAAIYALLCEPAAANSLIGRARDAIAAAMPVDAADAVALSTADDIIAFLDEANDTRHPNVLPACEPFAKLLEHRRGLVTLELAGVAVGNARRGTAESTTAFDTAMALLTRDGPRFEALLARAYAATFIRTSAPKAASPDLPDLTGREREILALLVEGLSNKEIAQRLVVSPRTIETHVERVLSKLEVGSRSRAIAKAVRMGLVPLDL